MQTRWADRGISSRARRDPVRLCKVRIADQDRSARHPHICIIELDCRSSGTYHIRRGSRSTHCCFLFGSRWYEAAVGAGGRRREGGVGSTAVVIAGAGSENFQARSRLEKESATSVSASNGCAGAWTAFETSTWVQHLDGLAAWCELVRFFAPMQPHAVRLERLRLLFASRRAAIWVEAAAGDRRDLIEAFLAGSAIGAGTKKHSTPRDKVA